MSETIYPHGIELAEYLVGKKLPPITKWRKERGDFETKEEEVISMAFELGLFERTKPGQEHFYDFAKSIFGNDVVNDFFSHEESYTIAEGNYKFIKTQN